MSRQAKQVIVMRKDLNMRKGKMIAQGAHASIGAFMLIGDGNYPDDIRKAFREWVHGTFTKVCVSVDSEAMLDLVALNAQALGLPVKVITDAGHTEFHGVPTKTCLAIGPAWAEDIDKVTGELPLL
jgi:PTH2 family peptidyl-tRNA hydrolase